MFLMHQGVRYFVHCAVSAKDTDDVIFHSVSDQILIGIISLLGHIACDVITVFTEDIQHIDKTALGILKSRFGIYQHQ